MLSLVLLADLEPEALRGMVRQRLDDQVHKGGLPEQRVGDEAEVFDRGNERESKVDDCGGERQRNEQDGRRSA